MSDASVLWRSFAGGEIAPDLYGRVDLAKYQTALTLCRNSYVMAHGPLMTRGGSRFVTYAKNNSGSAYSADNISTAVRLIPFTVNALEAYALELGYTNTSPKNIYIRLHRNGRPVTVDTATAANAGGGLFNFSGTINTTVAKPVITFSSPATHGLNVGDWVLIRGTGSSLDDRPCVVDAKTSTTVTLASPMGDNLPMGGAFASGAAISISGKMGKVLQYTISTDATNIDLFEIRYAQDATILTLTHPDMPLQEFEWLQTPNLASDTAFTISSPTFRPTIDSPASLTVTSSHPAVTTYNYAYIVTAVSIRGGEESYGSVAYQVTNDLTTDSTHKNTLSWSAVTGADRYRVYCDVGNTGVFGFIGEAGLTPVTTGSAAPSGTWVKIHKWHQFVPVNYNSGTTFTDINYVPDKTRTPPLQVDRFNTTNAYPLCCAYFQQRRVLAGTYDQPQNLWLSRSGAPQNMASSIPVRDDDAIQVKIASREANGIRHVVPLNDLLVLTQSGVWKVSSFGSDVLTPTNIAAKPQDFVGSSGTRPVVFSNRMVYANARGGRLAEVSYDWRSETYQTDDASLVAPHLFDAWRIVDLSYTVEPAPILWAVRSDGTLLGATYMPQQEVLGWHQHQTWNPDGTQSVFESVCTITEYDSTTLTTVDNTYFVVRRKVNGRSVRYIEYFGRRNLLAARRQYDLGPGDYTYYQPSTSGVDSVPFVDCAVTWFSSAAATRYSEISGLWHLEGAQVKIVGDGVPLGSFTVTSGKVTLPVQANLVHVGISYTPEFATVPLVLEQAPAAGQTMLKNVGRIWVRVQDSTGFYAGPSLSRVREYQVNVSAVSGSIAVSGQWPGFLPMIGNLLGRTTVNTAGGTNSAVSGMVELQVDPDWNHDGIVYFRHTDPTPLEVSAIGIEFSTGD